MKDSSKEQQRRDEQQRQALQRQETREQDQQKLPAKQAMSHLGVEKQARGKLKPLKSQKPGNSRGRKKD
jgi:hypothetical protein